MSAADRATIRECEEREQHQDAQRRADGTIAFHRARADRLAAALEDAQRTIKRLSTIKRDAL